MHLVAHDCLIDSDAAIVEVLFVAEDFVVHVGHSLIVACAREDIAYLELVGIPFGFLLWDARIDIAEAFSASLQHIFNILKDDTLYGAMVDLAELAVGVLCGQVDDETAAQIVLDLDHVAGQ